MTTVAFRSALYLYLSLYLRDLLLLIQNSDSIQQALIATLTLGTLFHVIYKFQFNA